MRHAIIFSPDAFHGHAAFAGTAKFMKESQLQYQIPGLVNTVIRRRGFRTRID